MPVSGHQNVSVRSILLKMEAHGPRASGDVLHYLLLLICFSKTGLFRFKWQLKLPPTSLHPVIFQLTSVHRALYIKCYIASVSEAPSGTL